jgi:hypothetical protein
MPRVPFVRHLPVSELRHQYRSWVRACRAGRPSAASVTRCFFMAES